MIYPGVAAVLHGPVSIYEECPSLSAGEGIALDELERAQLMTK